MNQTSMMNATWTLAECPLNGDAPRVICISPTPFVIGRGQGCSLTLPSRSISKRHAELTIEGGNLVVRDLNSTNGTFVNGRKVSHAKLGPEDLLQISGFVFRIGVQEVAESEATFGTMPEMSFDVAGILNQFSTLMQGEGIVPHFQPIVSLSKGSAIGFEMLARGVLENMQSPADMFSAAEMFGQEVELSELLRMEGVYAARDIPGLPNIFLNSHPKELAGNGFLDSLRTLRKSFPIQPITIELHESAITNTEMLRDIKAELRSLDMQLAYDDFGAGQSRLEELVEVPPDYVKFDMKLIRGIDRASKNRLELVESLIKVVKSFGSVPLAECIETKYEAEVCRELGFDLGQGYYFGRPTAAATAIA